MGTSGVVPNHGVAVLPKKKKKKNATLFMGLV
jgi:hypothetical protein